MSDPDLDNRIAVLVSIRDHMARFPEPRNQIVRDIAERRQITTWEVMRQMRDEREARELAR